MEFDIQAFADGILSSFKGVMDSPFILVVKILVGFYLLLLLVDIVLLLILRDVPAHIRVGIKGADVPVVSSKKMRKRWEKIKGRLRTENSSQFKVAVIEADALAEELLAGIGYRGANMTEKLEQVGEAHLDDQLEALQGVHKIRNNIVHEPNYEIDRKAAETALEVYENFFKYLDLF
jgi:hypothetical protein